MGILSATATGFRFVRDPSASPPAPAIISSTADCAWYDAKCHALSAADSVRDWLAVQAHQFLIWLGHSILAGIGIALPTLAAVGILWWMCPFLPWHEKGAKLTGAALILYMFFILLGGGDV